ncbi:MAG: hypothetical protein UX92_C0020G0006 [Candidatus Amesbacteria bacterium GW2011_GWA1_47_20]|nr:MAG: hypothetical protein UX92_C0020G0006 [Candidatus Amesbacteria bacterium GW2011_GWA1_47_20]
MDLLKISTYWHDVVVGEQKWPSKIMVEDTCQLLARILPVHGFSENEIYIITETVRHHEFRDTPTTHEGLILQDADKLDTLSQKRWERTIQAFKKGEMKEETFLLYSRTFFKWVPILSATFHFRYSRQSADKSVQMFWGDKEYRELIESLGLITEYRKAKVDMNTGKTKITRIFIRLHSLWTKVRINTHQRFKYANL